MNILYYKILSNKKKYFPSENFVNIFLISLYSSFACFGEYLFFQFSYVDITLKNTLLLLLGTILWFPIIMLLLHSLKQLNSKICNNKFEVKKSNYVILFFSTFIIWFIYLILCWPGIISIDSIDQHLQAIGTLPLSNHHNISHTLILRIIYNIYDNFTFAIVLQIIFSSIIWAYCIGTFSEKINIKYLIIFSIIFAAMPNNAKTVISLWKDIPYTFAFLLLIFVLSKSEGCINHSIKLKILFIFAFTAVALLRHNGIIVVFGTIIIYLIMSKYKRKLLYLITPVFLIISFVQFPLMKYLEVIPVSNWTKHITMYNDLVGVLIADGKMAPSTKSFLEKELTIENHREIYNPYIPVIYLYPQIKNKYLYTELGLNDISTKKMLTMYLDTLLKNPSLLIQNRLLGADVLWNCAAPKEYFSYSVSYVRQDLKANKNKLIKNENQIKQFIRDTYDNIKNNKIYIAIFNKTGIYLIFLLVLFLFANQTFSSKSLIVFVPIMFQTLGVLLAIQAQDYRYVWPIFVSFWFILLFYLTKIE